MTKHNNLTYPFVDLIRFISMLGIVWAHTDALPRYQNSFIYLQNIDHPEYFILLKQLFKFSVVCFFMISGFLLGGKITFDNPIQYFIRRVKTTLVSYLFAFSTFILIYFLVFYPIINGDFLRIQSYPEAIYNTLFYTPYWFLPTYYIGLFTILIFSKHISSAKFGFLLFLITLFYTYSSHIVPSLNIGTHSTAIFAFVFYIWLGAYINRKGYVDKIKKIPTKILVGLVIITYFLASYTSYELLTIGNKFYSNNLRIFNQLYGVLFFVLMIKICPGKPNFWRLNPRKETFGIYLYHFYFVTLIYPILAYIGGKLFNLDFENLGIYNLMFFSVLHFLMAYLFTLLFVKYCIKKGWKIV